MKTGPAGQRPAVTRRYAALDALRGIAILGVVFLHFALYNYTGLLDIDFDNPPFVITILGLFLAFAGLLAVISGAAYAATVYGRYKAGVIDRAQLLRSYLVAGATLLILSYVYFLISGPSLLDLEQGNHQHSVLVGLIRTGTLNAPPFERIIYNTSLTMIGWNLLLTGPVVWLLTRGGRKGILRYVILLSVSIAVLLISVTRIYLFPALESLIESRRVFPAVPIAFLINKNDPILPYFAFGLLGTTLGTALVDGVPRRRILSAGTGVGIVLLIAGIVGMLTLPDTMLERSIDFFWYFLVLLQAGVFALLVVWMVCAIDLAPERRRERRTRRLRLLRYLGTVSLTVFMLESIVNALLARAAWAVYEPWADEIPRLLAASLVVTILWIPAMLLWRKAELIGTFESMIALVHRGVGRRTAKIDAPFWMYRDDGRDRERKSAPDGAVSDTGETPGRTDLDGGGSESAGSGRPVSDPDPDPARKTAGRNRKHRPSR